MLKGQRYGRLTVLRLSRIDPNSERVVTAECDCGAVRYYKLSNLRTGNTKSCGCLQREVASWTQRNRQGRVGLPRPC